MELRHLPSLSQLYRDAPSQPEREVGVFEDITERKRWEEHQRLLINEFTHRVKNTLTTRSFDHWSGLRAAEISCDAYKRGRRLRAGRGASADPQGLV